MIYPPIDIILYNYIAINLALVNTSRGMGGIIKSISHNAQTKNKYRGCFERS
mgnify:CR=1 FL=1